LLVEFELSVAGSFEKKSGWKIIIFRYKNTKIDFVQGLNVECLPTEDAIASFNYLCSENRLVDAALIQPDKVRFISSDHEVTAAAYR
jgi:hypothetical protein